MRLLITGANGHIGRRLIRQVNEKRPELNVIALVRSESAAGRIRQDGLKADVRVVDYADAKAIRGAVAGFDGPVDAIVHLVGIIRETRHNSFEQAHEDACQALVAAELDARQIICLGILGSSVDSANACLASRGRAERILLDAEIPASILRVPMVLGPDDYASRSLAGNARKRFVLTFRAGSLEQPIDSEDVIAAVMACIDLDPENRVIELAGPESLSRGELIRRAGRMLGLRPHVISIPFLFGYCLAWLLESLSASPPVTRAMLGVLDHDDRIDVKPATDELKLTLTSLDETLNRVIT